ncbi:hypothetical protein [Streptomyces sp. NBC_01481]|uniref:hypothetical protein n=1 Tax=Streptomyces sp. NBC_01481 TaxID=2975869 RepID=UPI00225B6EE7|nr:hypothetical protein [Streptomyces sp. NBC_01481]MCX4587470.1 hypothetical protein [Streptomyces sp. NBC_01481]
MESKHSSGHVEIKSAVSGEVEAVFASLNCVDRDDDVTLPGAFKSGAKVAISAFGHKSWEGVLPVGKGTIHENGNEVVLRGRFFLQTSGGRDAFQTVKELADGPGMEWSYGFQVLDSDRGQFEGRSVRFLKRLKVHEVSPVLRGSGINTRVLAVKSYSSVKDELNSIYAELQHDILDEIARTLDRDMKCAAIQSELEAAARTVSIGYSNDLEWAVLSETKNAAKAAVAEYAPRLGIDPSSIKIKYFSEEADPEFVDQWSLQKLRGYCRPIAEPNVVWIHSELDACDAWSVSAHEIRHIAGGSEDDAMVYETAARLDWLEES